MGEYFYNIFWGIAKWENQKKKRKRKKENQAWMWLLNEHK